MRNYFDSCFHSDVCKVIYDRISVNAESAIRYYTKDPASRDICMMVYNKTLSVVFIGVYLRVVRFNREKLRRMKNRLAHAVGCLVSDKFNDSFNRIIIKSIGDCSISVGAFEYPVFSVSYIGLRKFTEKFIIENYAN